MAKRPPVKRELAVTPGGQEGCQGAPGSLAGAAVQRKDRSGGEAAGRSLQGLTQARLVAFVVLPEGHQPDGDGLQEWPDGGRELWRHASKSGTRSGQEWGGAETWGVDVVIQQTFSELWLRARHCSRHLHGADVVEKTDNTQIKACHIM